MGIEYVSNYGIGYRVCESEGLEESGEMGDGLEEYISCEVGEGFECFTTGNAFSGETSGVYLTITEPFKGGLDLTAAKECLDREIKRLKLDKESEFDEVGGLYIY